MGCIHTVYTHANRSVGIDIREENERHAAKGKTESSSRNQRKNCAKATKIADAVNYFCNNFHL